MAETDSSVGLVLGRFQPLHPGHLRLIDMAVQECDEVVVCIGSAQTAEPLTLAQRRTYLGRQLGALYTDKNWRLDEVYNTSNAAVWPQHLKDSCGLDSNNLRLYRGNQLPLEDEEKFKQIGFEVFYVTRQPFFYKAPNGLYYKVSSATEIRAIYQDLGLDLADSLDML